MHCLVLNSGSSSLKFSIFACESEDADPETILDGEVSGIGTAAARLEHGATSQPIAAPDPAAAVHAVLDELSKPGMPPLDAVGYRVVHPGPKIDRHLRIDAQVLADLEAAIAFAPLHNPEAIALIRACMARFDHIPHFACFDTIFHQTMPPAATTYPIPLTVRDQGVRRYGFHGLSCESVVRQLHSIPGRLVIAHLGSGCSVTALRNGKSIDTSMGLTPTGGVIMGTRPGDLDPGLILFLLRQPGATIHSVEHMLNHDSGLKALAGSNDMRQLRSAHDDPAATLALAIFVASVRRAIGGMIALYGIDALVFTGGIGEHDPLTRDAITSSLFPGQPVDVRVVPAQEDLVIALHVARMLSASSQ
jgi:acetate kinase